jgi:hypothetical protein
MRRVLPFFVAVIAFAVTFALSGCEDAAPVLAGTPTPAATPTPLPEPFTAEITAAPAATDALGNLLDGELHYQQYLSFGELRVYEYGDGTFLDGICVNAYPQPMEGEMQIVYRTSDGKVCGIGTIHNARSTTLLETGSNAIYAEISTDIDVTGLDFTLEIKTPYRPVPVETAPAP